MVKTFKDKADLHIARKVWHFTGVLIIIVLFHNLSYDRAFKAILFTSLFLAVFEVARFRIKSLNKFFKKTLFHVIRASERNSVSGITYMLFGCLIIVSLFPKDITMLSLYFLAAADPLASYIGVKYGKDKLFENKSLQGSLAAFAVCTVLSYMYFSTHGLMGDHILIASVLAGLSGSFSEMLAFGKMDDNFSIPVVSSILLWVIFYVFGGL